MSKELGEKLIARIGWWEQYHGHDFIRISAGAAHCVWRAASRMPKMEGGAYAWTADN